MNNILAFFVGLFFLVAFWLAGGLVMAQALNTLAGWVAGGEVTWVGGAWVLAALFWVGFFVAFGAYIVFNARKPDSPGFKGQDEFYEALSKLKAMRDAFGTGSHSSGFFDDWRNSGTPKA